MDNPLIQNASKNHYYIDRKYTARATPEYCHVNFKGVTWQPNVYSLARYIAERLGCEYIIDIGSGAGFKLANMHPSFRIIGVDIGENLKKCQSQYPFGTWIEHDLDTPAMLPLPEEAVKHSLVICADVIEHLVHPGYLLWKLKTILEQAPICLISTPERVLTYRYNHMGPPRNMRHVREWTMDEFKNLLHSFQFNLKFAGLTVSNDKDLRKETILAILGNNSNNCRGFDSLISHTDIHKRL